MLKVAILNKFNSLALVILQKTVDTYKKVGFFEKFCSLKAVCSLKIFLKFIVKSLLAFVIFQKNCR